MSSSLLAALLAALTVLACANRDHAANQSVATPFLAALDATCGFDTTARYPNPTRLATEFVQRASRAEFDRTEDWMPRATICPAHEPGYDTFAVADSFSLISLDSTTNSARFILRRSIVGETSGGRFYPANSTRIDTLVVRMTPFGWRIANPVWNWATVSVARERQWLQDTARSSSPVAEEER